MIRLTLLFVIVYTATCAAALTSTPPNARRNVPHPRPGTPPPHVAPNRHPHPPSPMSDPEFAKKHNATEAEKYEMRSRQRDERIELHEWGKPKQPWTVGRVLKAPFRGVRDVYRKVVDWFWEDFEGEHWP